MKYAIKDEYWWFDTYDYIDHKDAAWVMGIMLAQKFHMGNSDKHRVIHTKFLGEAKLYNTSEEAAAVASLIATPKCPSHVVEISDRRLFEAKLKGQ